MRASLFILIAFLFCIPAIAQERDNSALRKKAVERRIREILEEKVLSHTARQSAGMDKSTQPATGLYERPVMDIPSVESEIHAAVNPVDSANIIVAPIQVSFMQGISLPTFVTTDFGETWQETSTRYSGDGGGDPVLTFDADGKAYFSWLEFKQEDIAYRLTLFVSESDDKGFTWSEPLMVADSYIVIYGGQGNLVDKEWMDVDRSNSPRRNTLYVIYVVLKAAMESDVRIEMRTKSPGQEDFDAGVIELTEYEDFLTLQYPSVNVDADGNVHAFCWGIDKYSFNGLFHAMSTDGATFSEFKLITPIRYPYLIDVFPLDIPDHMPQRMGALPQFAVDANQKSPFRNALYAVWNCNDMSSTADATYDEPMHVYFIASHDQGETWGEPIRMDDAPDRESNQFHPSITVSPSGAVIVTWYDGRENRDNTEIHYYMAVSYDGGKTFGPNIRVTSVGSNATAWDDFGIGDYDRAICTEHYAIPIWADGRNNDGDMDVYAGFIPIGTTTGLERIMPVTTGCRLKGPVPNPTSGTTTISFELDRPTQAEIEIYDERGTLVTRLAEDRYQPGAYSIPFNAVALQPGAYFVRLQTGMGYAVQRLTVLK